MDIIVEESNNVSWYQNINGNGSFGARQVISKTHDVFSVYSEDMDGDGDMDILAHGNKMAWYENTDGFGTFQRQHVISAGSGKSISAVDLNGDANVDILSGHGNKIVWHKSIDGNGNFDPQLIIASDANNLRRVIATDIDNDGDLDVLSVENQKVVWYENLDGNGDFETQRIITSTGQPESVYPSDVDGDGDIDIFSALRDEIVWFENTDGQGTFGAPNSITPPPIDFFEAIDVYAADLDGDGDDDMLFSQYYNRYLGWYENIDGQGTFQSRASIGGGTIDSIHAADLDSDGDLDVMVARINEAEVVWYENTNGNGSFGPARVLLQDDNPSSVYSADIDGDGDIDVISGSGDYYSLNWHENLLLYPPNRISGTVGYDIDGNDCSSSVPAENILVSAVDGGNTISTFTKANGSYNIPVNQGQFEVSITSRLPYYNSNPTNHAVNFVGTTGFNAILDFCLEPNQVVNDLVVSVYPSINDPRPGFDTTYKMVYRNIGTSQLSGDVVFEYDAIKLQFLTASETIASQTSNTVKFNFANLKPAETRTIDLDFNVLPPPTTNIDEILVSKATINPISGDETEDNNVFDLKQVVIGSYDPNDIRVLEGERILFEDADKYLHYIIRFQNTGTASAINVRVENVLDSKLDWTSLQIESLSHDGNVEILNGSQIKFIFNNINLPDSTSNEPDSHGYIAYKIKPKDNVVLGDVFSAKADIFFDFNPPIITNIVTTEIVNTLSNEDQNLIRFSIYPNPVNELLTIIGQEAILSIKVYDLQGRILNEISYDDLELNRYLNTSPYSSGIYFLEIQSERGKQIQKLIKK